MAYLVTKLALLARRELSTVRGSAARGVLGVGLAATRGVTADLKRGPKLTSGAGHSRPSTHG